MVAGRVSFKSHAESCVKGGGCAALARGPSRRSTTDGRGLIARLTFGGSHNSNPCAADEDLAVQALPGHCIPSQDADPAAQTLLEPKDAAREASSVLMGGGESRLHSVVFAAAVHRT